MTHAYRMVQRLNSNYLTVNLPPSFTQGHEVEIIVLPLESGDAIAERQLMHNWLTSVWGSDPDFPYHPAQPLLDNVSKL
jgi:hypothetical protein